MRIQQKENNVYVKGLDKVDQYLVNIIKRYFESDQEEIWLNREDIINEAVRRAKEEIGKHLANGSFAVTSVNGKTGDVIITCGDINAEPQILIKHSAFNKPFGKIAGTICEGNDERLSDERRPLPHTHDEYLSAVSVDERIEEWLRSKGITFSNGKVKIVDCDLEIRGGEVIEE